MMLCQLLSVSRRQERSRGSVLAAPRLGEAAADLRRGGGGILVDDAEMRAGHPANRQIGEEPAPYPLRRSGLQIGDLGRLQEDDPPGVMRRSVGLTGIVGRHMD